MGPCLCGDPCCSYYGDPSLARYEALCDAFLEQVTPIFPFIHTMIDHEWLLGYIVTNLLDVKARPFITALYEEVKRQEKEEDDERRYAERLAKAGRYEEEYRKSVEVTHTHYMSQEQVDSLKEMIEKAEKVKADLESVCEV